MPVFMTLVKKLKHKLKNILRYNNEIKPSKAYDLWAADYDHQTDNPLIFLDELVFNLLITPINIEHKTIVDIGCGTGRHWPMLLAKKPLQIIGCDVSKEMLDKLTGKYPQAKTYLTDGVSLKQIRDKSCDLIICNLALGYIKDLSRTFGEWHRILKSQGEIIITDFHPAALTSGGNRTLTHNGKLFFIKNYIHPLSEIQDLAGKKNYKTVKFIERTVDETIKHFYEHHNSLNVYNKDYRTPILYGLHLKNTL